MIDQVWGAAGCKEWVMRLVITLLLFGLLTGCVSDRHGYYHEPDYGPVYAPYHGPLYDPYYHPPRPYLVVPGRAHHGYRIEQRDYRALPHHSAPPSYRPRQGHGVNPPGQHHWHPVVAPGYRRHEGPRHEPGRGHAREEHRRSSRQMDRDTPRERWQGSPRPHWGGGHPGRSESRRHR